jgi:ribosomal protein L7/L12
MIKPVTRSSVVQIQELRQKLEEAESLVKSQSARLEDQEDLVRSLSTRLEEAIRHNDGQQRLIRSMEREAEANSEVLRLTRALSAAQAKAQAVGSLPLSDGDTIVMADGKKVSRKLVEEAAAYGRLNGLSTGSFIPAIKSVREQTGCGLREAKEFCDRYFSHLKM